MADDPKRDFEVGPASKMQKKYGWYAKNRPRIQVNPKDVPSSLHDLIPYVERWAIACDITRRDYFQSQPEAELREFAQTVGSREQEINEWLDSIEEEWPEAADHFMYLLKAWSDAACEFGDDG